jgi:[protein-PII] uridylyltransferase
LARLSAVIERDGLDIVWARVTTRGSSVDDVFGLVAPALTTGAGTADYAAAREELEREMYAVLPAPPPKPVSEAS